MIVSVTLKNYVENRVIFCRIIKVSLLKIKEPIKRTLRNFSRRKKEYPRQHYDYTGTSPFPEISVKNENYRYQVFFKSITKTQKDIKECLVKENTPIEEVMYTTTFSTHISSVYYTQYNYLIILFFTQMILNFWFHPRLNKAHRPPPESRMFCNRFSPICKSFILSTLNSSKTKFIVIHLSFFRNNFLK